MNAGMAFCASMAVVIVVLVSYKFGAYEASERFYKECQGGEVYFKGTSDVSLPSIGCAEIARHVR